MSLQFAFELYQDLSIVCHVKDLWILRYGSWALPYQCYDSDPPVPISPSPYGWIFVFNGSVRVIKRSFCTFSTCPCKGTVQTHRAIMAIVTAAIPNGIIFCRSSESRSSHGCTTVLETLKNVLRTMNANRHSSSNQNGLCLSSAKLRSTDSVNPRAVLSRVRPRYRHLLETP